MSRFMSISLVAGARLNLVQAPRVHLDAPRSRFLTIVAIFLAFALLATSVTAQDYEPCREDFDGNYSVGLEDQITMTDCFTGPGVDNLDINCVPADFDRDHHIDLRDLANLTPKSGPCHLCAMKWAEDISCFPGVNGDVYAMTMWDDGTGLALYVGGKFSIAGCAVAANVAKWDGSEWSALGPGVNNTVRALAVFDDGTGAALYAGGFFTKSAHLTVNRIAKWDGSSWSSVGAGFGGIGYPYPEGSVNALAVFDDGTGPVLVAGGEFLSSGGPGIAKWNGSTWAGVGTGLYRDFASYPIVYALKVYEGGNTPTLWVGGDFRRAGGVNVANLAYWDGARWSTTGSGATNRVFALEALENDEGGQDLYAAGEFSSIDDVAVNRIARWNGSTWSPLGQGVAGQGSTVNALSVFDDGNGTSLYVGGSFAGAGGVTANRIARWNGQAWSAVPSGLNRTVYTLSSYQFDAESALYIGGNFTTVGSVDAGHVASWNGATWASLGNGLNDGVLALAQIGTDEPQIVAGGLFTFSGGDSGHCARREDAGWFPLGPQLDGDVKSLAVASISGKETLFAGGEFQRGGGRQLRGTAEWDGTSWHPIGLGITSSSNDAVDVLYVLEDGSASKVFAGGSFTTIGGIAANRIAQWNGVTWAPLGSGMNGNVLAFAHFDNGSGPVLFAGGWFQNAGGITAIRVAQWNGITWSTVGSGVSTQIDALEQYDDGIASALYAGGRFGLAGGVDAKRIARWDGLNWSPVGTGFNDQVYALEVFDDRTGPALYAGGTFTMAGNVRTSRIAMWDGLAWNPLGLGVDAPVMTLKVLDDGTGAALYAGGFFAVAGGKASAYVAKWYRPSVCEGPPEMSKGD